MLTILIIGTVLELGFWIFEESISKDIIHINSINRTAKKNNDIIVLGNSLTRHGVDKTLFEKIINERKNNDIIVLGNSLTRHGVDKTLFEKTINERKNSVINIGYIYPDDTSIIEWYYILKSYFTDNGIIPNNIVINFSGNQLKTDIIKFEEIQRISKYVPISKLSFVIKKENLTLSETLDYVLSKCSRIYAYRERLSKRILNILPKYKEMIRYINKSKKEDLNQKLYSNYSHFNDIIKLADSLDFNLSFCAMPLPNSYPIDDYILYSIDKSENCQLFDFKDSEIILDNHYLDGYHLNKSGARLYTKEILNHLFNTR